MGSNCFSPWKHDSETMIERRNPVISDKNQRSQGTTKVLKNIDCVPSNVQSSHQDALLYVFEDNEAVVKVIIKGKRSDNVTCFQDPQSCA